MTGALLPLQAHNDALFLVGMCGGKVNMSLVFVSRENGVIYVFL